MKKVFQRALIILG